MASSEDFGAVFRRLRDILEPYGRRMHVSTDTAALYGVDMAVEAKRDPTTWFGGVRLGKRYVSYYLMPVYVEPVLLEGASPALRRRMQGKSCFNFTSVDEALFSELAELTRHGYERAAGDAAWEVARRGEHGLAHRKAMSSARSGPRRPVSDGPRRACPVSAGRSVTTYASGCC